jgi:hypothetical protein
MCKIVGVYELIVIILGTFGNLFIFYVSYPNRKDSIFLFLLFLSISDMISLYWWNLNHFVLPFTKLDLQNYSFYYCKVINFFQFTSSQVSAWILILISFDRYLSVLIFNWKTTYFNVKRAFVTVSTLVIIIILLNIHVLFTFGHIRKIDNATEKIECYSSPDSPETYIMAEWDLVIHSFFFFIIFKTFYMSKTNI